MQLIQATILDRVHEIAQSFARNINVSPDMTINQLSLDSLDKVEFVMQIEEEFGIEIDDTQAVESLNKTVKELADFVCQEVARVGQWGAPQKPEQEPFTFESMVAGLVKPGEAILAEMDTAKAICLAVNLEAALSASRKVDRMKKYVIYGKEQDAENVIRSPVDEGCLVFMSPEMAHKLHMAIGLFGEAGEILEAVIAEIETGSRDTANEIEESGDIEFYHEGYRQACGFTREQAIKANIEKLGKRYQGHKYTDAQAIARADKSYKDAVQSAKKDWSSSDIFAGKTVDGSNHLKAPSPDIHESPRSSTSKS